MEAKKSNKIRDVVRLQQILKKWRKLANASKANGRSSTTTTTSCNTTSTTASKGIKFLKRTLSLSDVKEASGSTVRKGYLAVSVGEEQKRFTIPTEYLSHQAFHILLREAEEVFGFHQTGVLRIPCEVSVFESILKIVEEKKDMLFLQECRFNMDDITRYGSTDGHRTPSHQPQSPMCR